MIRRAFMALATIIGDEIDSWATKRSRGELLQLLREQTERVRELEDELDARAATEESLRAKVEGHRYNYKNLQANYYDLELEVEALLGVHFNCPGCGRMLKNQDVERPVGP